METFFAFFLIEIYILEAYEILPQLLLNFIIIVLILLQARLFVSFYEGTEKKT